MTPEFLLTSFVVVIAPGAGVLYTLGVALGRGRAASYAAALGCTLGILPHIAAAILGVAALLHASALAFQTVKLLGIAYLLYLAWMTLADRGALAPAGEPDPRGAVGIAVSGFLVNILNPKLSVFFLAFLPQFIDAGVANPLPQMLGLSAVFMLMTFVVFVAYGTFAAAMRDRIITRPRVMTFMRRTFAATFVLLSARLALTAR
ncbi:MAG: LysE family translocator [Rhizobiaceae bacterium]